MLKSELVQRIHARNGHLYSQDIDKLVNIVLDEIANALKDGGRVELRGFGAFSVKSRQARVGRNPRTGTPVEVNAKRMPAFRCSKELHKRLNDVHASTTNEFTSIE
jgi:integration host factor subunit beta